MPKRYITPGGRYPVLRSMAIVCLICSVLLAALTVIAALWAVTQLHDRSIGQRLLLGLYTLCGGCLAVFAVLALAEAVELFIDMATSLRNLALRLSPLSPSGEATSGSRNPVEEESAEVALLRGH